MTAQPTVNPGVDPSCPGLSWKRFWRQVGIGRWCCFVKHGRVWRSLCGNRTLKASGGQRSGRPPAVLRCGRCDGLEAEGVGAEESLPGSEGLAAREDPPPVTAPSRRYLLLRRLQSSESRELRAWIAARHYVGQRYGVRALRLQIGEVIGWTDSADGGGIARGARAYPGLSGVVVVDLRPR